MRLALMAGLYWFVKHERILSGASPQTRPYSWKPFFSLFERYTFWQKYHFFM